MLPPDAYLNARRTAPFHVQVAIIQVPPDLPRLGTARLSTRVIRVFRGHGKLRPGDEVSFDVSVCDSSSDVPVGGACWTDVDALAKAHFMEVFLDGTPPDCRVPFWQSEILAGPSRWPRMGRWNFQPGWRDYLVSLNPYR